MTFKTRITLTLAVISGFILPGCAGTETVTSSAATSEQFNNVLVITIAGDYNNRSQLERVIASKIRKIGPSASAWHSVIGGDKPVTREDVAAAIEEQGFDSVLAVRRLDGNIELRVKKSRTEIDAEPLGGRIVNLFRSDYTDYTKAGSIDLATEALLAVEFYSAETQDIVFSFDHQTKKETNLGLLIDQTAETIVKRIDRQKLLAD